MKVLPPPALHLQLHHLHPAKHHLVTWPQNSSGLHDVACVHFDFKQTMYAVCLINLVNTYGLPFAGTRTLTVQSSLYTGKSTVLSCTCFAAWERLATKLHKFKRLCGNIRTSYNIKCGKAWFLLEEVSPFKFGGEGEDGEGIFTFSFLSLEGPKDTELLSGRLVVPSASGWVHNWSIACPWRCSTSAHVPRHATATSCRACSRSVPWLQIFRVEAFTSH